jgi:hypothetical protein
VGWISPNFDVGSIRFVNTRHRILAFAVAAMPVVVTVAVAMTAVIAATHAFVLTVSHVSPVR